MTASRPILRIGLTGGIASGKTTVSGFLTELGAHVIDADRIAHDLLGPSGDAQAEVLARFGTTDRKALGDLVFRDSEARAALNEIVHPKVRVEVERRIARAVGPIAIVDAALLVETGMHRTLDKLIVVRCSPESQTKRLLARGLTEEEAEARVAAQAPLEDKLAVADYVIDTETTLEETREQTAAVYADLRGQLP